MGPVWLLHTTKVYQNGFASSSARGLRCVGLIQEVIPSSTSLSVSRRTMVLVILWFCSMMIFVVKGLLHSLPLSLADSASSTFCSGCSGYSGIHTSYYCPRSTIGCLSWAPSLCMARNLQNFEIRCCPKTEILGYRRRATTPSRGTTCKRC